MIGDIIIANVIASAVLVLFIYLFDLNEKEPPWTLVRVYLLSILMTFLFGKLKGFLFTKYAWEFSPWIDHYIVAGFFEELLKLLVVLIFVWPLKSFNEETDGIIYYLIVAAGFTVLENVGYSFRFVIQPYLFGLQTGEMTPYWGALQKIVTLRMVSGHIFINVVSGYFLGLARRRHQKHWILVGFIAAVLLHGTWNQTASWGTLGLFALAFLALDGFLFVRTIRSSFYFKFLRRLKSRMDDLMADAKKAAVNPDVILLMENVKQRLRALRQMEGSELNEKAKEIVQVLPARLDEVSVNGPGGLTERLLKVNGILGRQLQKNDRWFWLGLFSRFTLAGFLMLLILMELM